MKKILLAIFLALILSACASVRIASPEYHNEAGDGATATQVIGDGNALAVNQPQQAVQRPQGRPAGDWLALVVMFGMAAVVIGIILYFMFAAPGTPKPPAGKGWA